MNTPDSPNYSRSPDLVWRLASDRVLVRRVSQPVADPAADAVELVGPAALIWVAAEHPISATQLGADTGTPAAVTAQSIALLIDGGWLTEVPA